MSRAEQKQQLTSPQNMHFAGGYDVPSAFLRVEPEVGELRAR